MGQISRSLCISMSKEKVYAKSGNSVKIQAQLDYLAYFFNLGSNLYTRTDLSRYGIITSHELEKPVKQYIF